MIADLTNEMVFGFNGPNLSMLGNMNDFKMLSESILELMDPFKEYTVNLNKLYFITREGQLTPISFSSKKGANNYGVFDDRKNLIFELDSRYWERIFKYFVLMSWDRKTFYLNNYENCLIDLDLKQDCNLICSSEF